MKYQINKLVVNLLYILIIYFNYFFNYLFYKVFLQAYYNRKIYKDNIKYFMKLSKLWQFILFLFFQILLFFIIYIKFFMYLFWIYIFFINIKDKISKLNKIFISIYIYCLFINIIVEKRIIDLKIKVVCTKYNNYIIVLYWNYFYYYLVYFFFLAYYLYWYKKYIFKIKLFIKISRNNIYLYFILKIDMIQNFFLYCYNFIKKKYVNFFLFFIKIYIYGFKFFKKTRFWKFLKKIVYILKLLFRWSKRFFVNLYNKLKLFFKLFFLGLINIFTYYIYIIINNIYFFLLKKRINKFLFYIYKILLYIYLYKRKW